ncbi:MAG: LPS-assembly protein LptD [Pseudolabrys sp.]|jgi:LPS-assembly protein
MAVRSSTRPSALNRRERGVFGVWTVLGLMVCGLVGGSIAMPAPARAQTSASTTIDFPAPPPPRAKSAAAIERDKSGQKQMLVQATEIDYDYANHRIAAVGNVQLYYGGATLEANKVVYDEKTKRLHAEGNVRLTDEDGKITYGEVMDLADDYRDGFVDSLRLDTPDRTRMAAAQAERKGGQFTVFNNGVYTACEPCKDNPKKPPLWQVKAARIIHDQTEKMIYFEDARIEFFGVPLAYLPYFSAPDPTVKRKTGFLMPFISSSSKYGTAVEVPYYWALAPNYDLTVSPMFTTKQGVLMQGEFRQRLINGAYSIRAAGIHQNDPGYFTRTAGVSTAGYRDNRGNVESSGRFAINEKWAWGWDALLVSDKAFIQDYNPRLSHYRINDPLQSGVTEGVSQLYLTGKGNRSYFDARSIYYLGLSESDTQAQIPVVHPVIDYMYTVDHPVIGGELGFNFNFTSLTRTQANFDAITKSSLNSGECNTADVRVKNSANCLLRGAPGTFSRFTAESHWKRSITDSYGQVFTPFASVRVDAGSMNVNNDPNVGNYVTPGETDLVRAMPTVGLEYRYPFISVSSWGTQTIEPIAQVIVRPNETQVGKWLNEDAQSLIFDDSNLFKVDKFAGYDRVEGGSRVNYGIQYTAQFNKGGNINALFGQSYNMFGQNSFAVSDTTNTGLDSGLDTRRSDYVARLTYQPNATFLFSSRFRFDQSDFSLQRMELETTATFDRWSASVLYGDYAAQPLIGFLDRRQGILGTGQYKLDANWVLIGQALYDINDKKFSQTRLGLGYIDDCLILAVNYITNYTYSNNVENNHTVMLQLSLRTLGGTSVNQSLNSQQ